VFREEMQSLASKAANSALSSAYSLFIRPLPALPYELRCIYASATFEEAYESGGFEAWRRRKLRF